MICPLLAIATPGDMKQAHRSLICCAKEECAWWDTTRKACSIEHIAYSLRILSEELIDIRHKMPQDKRTKARP